MDKKDKSYIKIVQRIIITITAGLLTATIYICCADDICAVPHRMADNIADCSSKDRTYFQTFVTPDDVAVQELASQIYSFEDAYRLASGWIYVSEQKLNNAQDKWIFPGEFLTGTPDYPNNPVPGKIAGDCEELANTLVSLIRAAGYPPEEVRVVLGQVPSGDVNKGHVWVEVFFNGNWLALDPSQGSYWDDISERLILREGLGFDYYVDHIFPVPEISAYYNDIYYLEPGKGIGNAPELWYVKNGLPDENQDTK